MRLAIGLVVSPSYRPENDFWFGRHQMTGEGFLTLRDRLKDGLANQMLPDDKQITGLRMITSPKFPTDIARNEICASVLAGVEDYLLFLDCDMVHPQTLPEQLLLADKPVITARYQLKKPPFATVAYVKHKSQEGPHRYASVHFGQGVFEIERGGAGALLIRRDVLQAVYDKVGHNFFRYQRGPEPPHDFTVSEDFWFYQQAREAGFKCYVDWECECAHVGAQAVDPSWNTPFLHRQVREYENPDTRDLILNNTIVRNYPGGMYLDDAEQVHVPEYQVTAGER